MLAAGWLADRTTLVGSNPFEGVSTALVAHPLAGAGTLAVVAAVTWTVQRRRSLPTTGALRTTASTSRR